MFESQARSRNSKSSNFVGLFPRNTVSGLWRFFRVSSNAAHVQKYVEEDPYFSHGAQHGGRISTNSSQKSYDFCTSTSCLLVGKIFQLCRKNLSSPFLGGPFVWETVKYFLYLLGLAPIFPGEKNCVTSDPNLPSIGWTSAISIDGIAFRTQISRFLSQWVRKHKNSFNTTL